MLFRVILGLNADAFCKKLRKFWLSWYCMGRFRASVFCRTVKTVPYHYAPMLNATPSVRTHVCARFWHRLIYCRAGPWSRR